MDVMAFIGAYKCFGGYFIFGLAYIGQQGAADTPPVFQSWYRHIIPAAASAVQNQHMDIHAPRPTILIIGFDIWATLQAGCCDGGS